MKRVRRSLAALAAVLLLALSAPAASAASITQSSGLTCDLPASYVYAVCAWEHGGGSGGTNSGFLYWGSLTDSRTANLFNYAHAPSGWCVGLIKVVDNWDDCISQILVKLSPGYSFCSYTEPNYVGLDVRLYRSTIYTTPGFWVLQGGWGGGDGALTQDVTSSMKFGFGGSGCF